MACVPCPVRPGQARGGLYAHTGDGGWEDSAFLKSKIKPPRECEEGIFSWEFNNLGRK